jgi:hypothetical protein
MLFQCDMSGMHVLSGLRASVETCPMGWAFPISEYDARYDAPTGDGRRSLSQDASPCLARVLPQGVGFSIVPCPGCPCRASGAVDHTLAFSPAGTSGASHVLRRLSACLPRPADAGGPSQPRPHGWAWVACGGREHPRRPHHAPFRRGASPAGGAVTPAAYRIRCLRFAHLVHRVSTAPPWTQDSLRVDGYSLPDKDLHLARDAKLFLAR